jgi:hypothetical protein
MREIVHNENVLAVIDNTNAEYPYGLSFYGRRASAVQVGRFRYDKGRKLRDHRHIRRTRQIEKTQEILIVMHGSIKITTYAETGKEIVDVATLVSGEYYILYDGGVGIEILEDDTRLLEVKPGTYEVDDDNLERELL